MLQGSCLRRGPLISLVGIAHDAGSQSKVYETSSLLEYINIICARGINRPEGGDDIDAAASGLSIMRDCSKILTVTIPS